MTQHGLHGRRRWVGRKLGLHHRVLQACLLRKVLAPAHSTLGSKERTQRVQGTDRAKRLRIHTRKTRACVV